MDPTLVGADWPAIFGARITAAREAAGMSRRQFAKRLGYAASSVADWESGVCVPTDASRLRIAETLGIPAETLFRYELPPPACARCGHQVERHTTRGCLDCDCTTT